MRKLFLFLFFAWPCHASKNSIEVTFSGNIYSATCNVDSESQNQSIDMGDTSFSDFSLAGETSEKTSFLIKLSDCSDSIKSAKIVFSGTSDSDDPMLLAINTSSEDSATGVGIEILDSSDTPIQINSAEPYTYSLSAGENEIPFALRYKSTSATVTPGSANAVMYFDLSYQ